MADTLTAHLDQEAALRARSLQRTRKLRAKQRAQQRQRRVQRIQEVGELVAACGLLWVDNARLTVLLKSAQTLIEHEDAF